MKKFEKTHMLIKKIITITLIGLSLIAFILLSYFYYYMNSNSVVITTDKETFKYYIPKHFALKEQTGDTLNLLIFLPQENRWSLRYWQYIPYLTKSESTLFLQFENDALKKARSFVRSIYGNRAYVFELNGTYNLKKDILKKIDLHSLDKNNKSESIKYFLKKLNLKETKNDIGIEAKYLELESQAYIKPILYR